MTSEFQKKFHLGLTTFPALTVKISVIDPRVANSTKAFRHGFIVNVDKRFRVADVAVGEED